MAYSAVESEATPKHSLKDADTIRQEIDASVQTLSPLLEVGDRVRSAYRGVAFDKRSGGKFLENRVFEYVSIMAPKTVANDPRIVCETAKGNDEARALGAALQAGLNQWIADTAHGRFLCKIAQDFYSTWCGVHVGLEVIPGGSDAGDARRSPVCTYIDPHDLFWDPVATSWEARMWSAHRYVRRVDDLLRRAKENPEEGWITANIHKCSLDVGIQEMGSRMAADVNVPRRTEIVAYDVWYPNGDGTSTLYTLAIHSGYGNGKRAGLFLREPRNYDGPIGGPHVLFASRSLLGSSLPISPIMVAWEQLVDLNAHARALSRAARRRKRIGIVNVLATPDGEKIKNANDGDVISVQGSPSGAGWWAELEVAGITETQVAAWQLLNARADRLLGFDDAWRGVADKSATATAVATASEAAGIRASDLIGTFEECDRQLLDAVAYYMLKSQDVKIPIKVSDDERKRIGMPLNMDVTYRGGDFDGDPRDYGIKIERYSMQRVSDAVAQRRAMDLINLIIALTPVAPQAAQIFDMEWAFDVLGDWMNMPGLGKMIGPQQAADLYGITGPPQGALGPAEQGGTTMAGQESGNALRV